MQWSQIVYKLKLECRQSQFSNHESKISLFIKKFDKTQKDLYDKLMFFIWVLSISITGSLCATPLADQFQRSGYVEITDHHHSAEAFDSLYEDFDACVAFLQENPLWAQKLYIAKERFIRSKYRNYYGTDVFGFYDEFQIRNQASFYYSIHFHEFICSRYPDFQAAPKIIRFLEACLAIQKPYGDLFIEAAEELGLKTLFASEYGAPPLLLKIVKYLPSHRPTRPHYDGAVFALFLDSTDNRSLLVSPYQSSLTVSDFSSPLRKFARESSPRSILLIPGTLLTDCGINPTPHVVVHNNQTRHATIAFAMRPNYTPLKTSYTPLPPFKP